MPKELNFASSHIEHVGHRRTVATSIPPQRTSDSGQTKLGTAHDSTAAPLLATARRQAVNAVPRFGGIPT